jgi:hypothetical protein
MEDVLRLLRKKPELLEINKGHTHWEDYKKLLEARRQEGA